MWNMTKDKDGFEVLQPKTQPEPLTEGTVEYNRHLVETLPDQIMDKVKEEELAESHDEAERALLDAAALADDLASALRALALAVTGRC